MNIKTGIITYGKYGNHYSTEKEITPTARFNSAIFKEKELSSFSCADAISSKSTEFYPKLFELPSQT